MDRIIDKFYNGSMSNFGFGTIGSKGPNLYTHKVMTPKPDPTKYTNNQSLFNPNKSQNGINNINTKYNASQTLFNNPVPKTQYSIGLQAPTVSDPLLTKALTIPFQPTQYDAPQNPYEPTKRYFKPEILKVQMLEQKIKEMEEKNKEDKRRMREIIEGNVLNVNNPPSQQQNIPIVNNNFNPNPNSLEQAMDNIRNQNSGLMDYSQKQALRRQQIQFELNQAREKLKNDRFFNGRTRTTSEDEEDEEEEEDEESDKLVNPEGGGLLSLGARPDEKKMTKSSKMNKTTKNSEKDLNPAEEEANEFIHNIPDHVALKLQADNFKVRANLAQVKDGFRNIRNQLEDKLEALQMAQRLNFEKIRFIIEQGGSKKMNAGIKKLLDGEDIDINNVQEETPEYIKNLPKLIEEKLRKNEERRKEEENQEKLEEQQMMDDEIGQRFNVTDENALQKFNPEDIKIDNVNEENPWEIIKRENKYEYIPGKGISMMGNIKRPSKNNLNQNIAPNQSKTNDQRMFTEEQEDKLVNKIADKILRTIRDNQYNQYNQFGSSLPQDKINNPDINSLDKISKISKNNEDEWLANLDDDEEGKNNKNKGKQKNGETYSKNSKRKNKSKIIPLTSKKNNKSQNEENELSEENGKKNNKTKNRNDEEEDEEDDDEDGNQEEDRGDEEEENEEDEEDNNKKNKRNIHMVTTGKSNQNNLSRSINKKIKKNKK